MEGEKSWLKRDIKQWLPQGEVTHLRHEEEEQIKAIKQGLVSALTTHDWYHNGAHYAKALSNFLDLKYTMKNTDWVFIVKVLYNMIISEGLDYDLQTRWALLLTRLLKRHKKFSLDENFDANQNKLVLPWRPIYDILVKTYFKSFREAIFVQKEVHGSALVLLAKKCKKFFDVSATGEILDELRPYMCAHDKNSFRGAAFFNIFLPTHQPHPTHLWVNEVFGMWMWIENTPDWDTLWLGLIYHLARDNIGLDNIDWTDHLPFLFTVALRVLDIPVGSIELQAPVTHKFPSDMKLLIDDPMESKKTVSYAAKLIVSLLHVPSTLGHLSKLLHYIERYYHPSNGGDWSPRLAHFLMSLTSAISERMGRESKQKNNVNENNNNNNNHQNQNGINNDKSTLSNEIIQQISSSLHPIIMLGMYSKSNAVSMAANHSLSILCYIYPEKFIPSVLETVVPALTTVTETHQTRAALDTLGKIARPLLWRERYPRGASQLADILIATLPGIDPNDLPKTTATLKFYLEVCQHIPFIDSSTTPVPSHIMLTDEDDEARQMTATFSDWIAQFLDKIFSIYSNQVAPQKGMNLESLIGMIIKSVGDVIFQQMSDEIHAEALNKLYAFVSGNILMNSVKSVGHIVSSASVAQPGPSLTKFVPLLYNMLVTTSTSTPHTYSLSSISDSEILWYLTIFAQLVKYTGKHLLLHKDRLLRVLDCFLRCGKSDKIERTAGKLYRTILKALLGTYVVECKSAPLSVWNTKEFLSTHFKHWGNPASDDLGIQWHIPSPEELQFANELLQKFAHPAMHDLNKIVNDSSSSSSPNSKSNSELRHTLFSCLSIFRNVVRAVPTFQDTDNSTTQLDEKDGDDEKHAFPPLNIAWKVVDYEICISLHEVITLMHQLCTYLKTHREDDTSTFVLLLKVMGSLPANRGGVSRSKMMAVKKILTIRKFICNGPPHLPKIWPRRIMAEKVAVLQMQRQAIANASLPLSPLWQMLLSDMLSLSTNAYSIIRKKAQTVFIASLKRIKGATNKYLPSIISMIGTGSSSDSQLTGAVYLLSNKYFLNRITSKWNHLSLFMKEICSSYIHHTPTVQARIHTLFATFGVSFYTLPLKVALPDKDFVNKYLFLKDAPDIQLPDNIEIEKQTKKITKANANREAVLSSTFSTLISLVSDNPTLHWRYKVYVASSLILLLRPDVSIPVNVQLFFVKEMASDLQNLRQIATKAVTVILRLKKNPVKRAMIIDSSFVNNRLPSSYFNANLNSSTTHGAVTLPSSTTLFVDKNFQAWNCKPVHPSAVYGGVEELKDDVDNETILSIICNSDYLGTLINYISNDKKSTAGGGSFNNSNAQMWKLLFRTFRLKLVPSLKSIVEKLVQETNPDEEKAHHAVVCEILAGVIRSSRHWTNDHLQLMWEWVLPLIKYGTTICSVDTANDWTALFHFISQDNDPRRLSPLMDFILSSPLDPKHTSANQAKKLRMIMPFLSEQSWRCADSISYAILETLAPNVAHPYKVVRDKISVIIAQCFRNIWDPPRNPETNLADSRSPFIPNQKLTDFVSQLIKVMSSSNPLLNNPSISITNTPQTHFYQTLINTLASAFRAGCTNSILPYSMSLGPYLFSLSESNDPDLARETKLAFGYLAQGQILPFIANPLFKSVLDMLQAQSWHARITTLPFLQVVTFRNIFLIVPEEKEELMKHLIRLLSDPQLEVRQLAATTLSGALNFVEEEKRVQLRRVFEKMAKTPLPKRGTELPTNGPSPLLERHAGVLGLSAVVLSYPYTLPSFLPALLVDLASHVTDPMPIRATVKSTFLDFWRTHQDQWDQNFKEKFEENQLTLLTELLVSPTYFA